jgi:hypothetical protein
MRSPNHELGQGARRLCANCRSPLPIKQVGRTFSRFRHHDAPSVSCRTKPQKNIKQIKRLQGRFGRPRVCRKGRITGCCHRPRDQHGTAAAGNVANAREADPTCNCPRTRRPLVTETQHE